MNTQRKPKGAKAEAELMKKVILSVEAGFFEWWFYPYPFICTILSIYHFLHILHACLQQ